MKNWLFSTGERFKICSYWIGAIFSWLLICGLFTMLFFVFTRPYISRVYNYNYIISETSPKEITKKDMVSIQQLVYKNKIIPVSAVYGDTLKYYDSIITILVALLGLFAFVSWFFLGGRMRESLHKELQAKWFEVYVNDKITKFLSANISDYIAEHINEEDIRSIVRQETESITNKISDEIQRKNNAVLNIPTTVNKCKKKRGK